MERLILIENRSSDELCLSEFAQSQIKLELIQNNNNNNQDQDDDIMNKSLSIVRKQKLQEFPSLYLDEDPTLIGTEEHASTRHQLASASDSSTTNNITSRSMNSLKRFVIYDEQDQEQQQQLDKDDREKSVEDLTGLRVATATSTERKNKVASRSTNELQEKKSNSEMSSNYYSYNNNQCPLMSVSSHSFNKNLSLGM